MSDSQSDPPFPPGEAPSRTGITLEGANIDTGATDEDITLSTSTEVVSIYLEPLPSAPLVDSRPITFEVPSMNRPPGCIQGKAKGHTKCRDAFKEALELLDNVVHEVEHQNELANKFRVSLNEYAGVTQKFMRKQQGDLKREAQRTIAVTIQSKGHQSLAAELKIEAKNLKARMDTKKAVRNEEYEEHICSLKQQQKDAVKENKRVNKDLLNAQKIELQKEAKTNMDVMQNKINIEFAKLLQRRGPPKRNRGRLIV